MCSFTLFLLYMFLYHFLTLFVFNMNILLLLLFIYLFILLKQFPLPHSHLNPSLRGNLSNFWMSITAPKLESLGYRSVKTSWS